MDLSGLAALLMLLHTGISNLTENEIWKLEQPEADAASLAAQNVLRHFDIMGKSAFVADCFVLAGTVGAIYAPRIIASGIRKSANDRAQ